MGRCDVCGNDHEKTMVSRAQMAGVPEHKGNA